MSVSLTVFSVLRLSLYFYPCVEYTYTFVESRKFSLPPVGDDSIHQNFTKTFGLGKPESLGYHASLFA